MHVTSVSSALPKCSICSIMKEHTQLRNLIYANSAGSGLNKSVLYRFITRNKSILKTSASSVPDQALSQVQTYSCWICQEECSSSTSLLEHYDNHMI